MSTSAGAAVAASQGETQSAGVSLTEGPACQTSVCAGVFCCVPSGLPAGLPQLVLDLPSNSTYPSAMLVECTDRLGITMLKLSHLSLAGSIETLDLAPLAHSLTTVDLSGNGSRLLRRVLFLFQQLTTC